MTPTIQAAIAALTRYDESEMEGGGVYRHADGDYVRYADVLAALQAAQPVQSIDAAGAVAWVNGARLQQTAVNQHDENGNPLNIAGSCLQTEYCDTPLYARAHIAQRASVADSPSVQQIVDAAHKYGTQDMRRQPCKDDFQFTPRQLVDFVRALAAPAPIADVRRVDDSAPLVSTEHAEYRAWAATENYGDQWPGWQARAKLQSAPIADEVAGDLTDAEIEQLFHERGGRWDGSVWVLEDADLYPFVRTIEARAAHVPIADEVAGEDEPWASLSRIMTLADAYASHTGTNRGRRALREAVVAAIAARPPAPKACAEPVAGELPPLPKGPYANYDADDMMAYASVAIAKFMPMDDSELIAHADAARAAAAPAGHAEPVAIGYLDKNDLQYLSQSMAAGNKTSVRLFSFESEKRLITVPVFSSPVAAEPAPGPACSEGERDA